MLHAAPTAASTTRFASREDSSRVTFASSARWRFSASRRRWDASRSVMSRTSTRTAASSAAGNRISSCSRGRGPSPEPTTTEVPLAPRPSNMAASPRSGQPRSARNGRPSTGSSRPRRRTNATFAQRTANGARASMNAGGLPVPRPDGERLVEHEERRLERVDDALVVLVEAVELRRALLELGVRGAELGVDRLQLLDRGLELLVGRLQLLVGGLELLVGRLQLLVGGLELLVGSCALLVCVA